MLFHTAWGGSGQTVAKMEQKAGMGVKADYGTLVARAKENDGSAWAELYDLSYKSIHFIAKEFFKSEEDVEDAEQEAYLKIYRNIGKLEEPEKYLAWAKQITTNVCIDIRRKRRDFTFSDVEGASGLAEEDITFEVEDLSVEFRPEAQMDIAETSRIIKGMMAELPEEQRVTLDLLYGSELSVRDIAEAMGVSENTVKSRLRYGRNAMEEKIEALKKRGTKLYAAPVGVLLYNMLHSDIEGQAAVGAGVVIAQGMIAAGAEGTSASATSTASAASAASTASAVSAGKAAGGTATVGSARVGGVIIRTAGQTAAASAAASAGAAGAASTAAGAVSTAAGTVSTAAGTVTAAAGSVFAAKGLIAAAAAVVVIGGGSAIGIATGVIGGSSGQESSTETAAETFADMDVNAGTQSSAEEPETFAVNEAEKSGEILPGWNEIDGEIYYYDENLEPVKGWLDLAQDRFYLDEASGIRRTGWQKISGEDYYFDPESGAMLRDQWLDGYYLGPGGSTGETGAMLAYGKILAEYLYGYRGSVGSDLERQSWHGDTGTYQLRYLLKDANEDGVRELCVVSDVPADETDQMPASYFTEALFSYVNGEVKAPYEWKPADQFESLGRQDIPFNNRSSASWLNGNLEYCEETAHSGGMSRTPLGSDGMFDWSRESGIFGYNSPEYYIIENGVETFRGPSEGTEFNLDNLFDYGPELDGASMTLLTADVLKQEFDTDPAELGLYMQPAESGKMELSREAIRQMEEESGTEGSIMMNSAVFTESSGELGDPYHVIEHPDYYEIERALRGWIPLFVSKNAVYRNWMYFENQEEIPFSEYLAKEYASRGEGLMKIDYGAYVKIEDGLAVLFAQMADE